MPAEICDPFIIDDVSDSGESGGQHAVLDNKLWNIEVGKASTLAYWFIGGTKNQRRAVESGMTTWEKYANVQFVGSASSQYSVIRIGFKAGEGTCSAVGTDALGIDTKKTTMNFSNLADDLPASAEDFANILHELGHALGMVHEHQSPARGGHVRLKEVAIYAYYKVLYGWEEKITKKNVIDPYNLSQVSNMSAYFIPANLNERNVRIPENLNLSDMDKAFITLSYPRKPPAIAKPPMPDDMPVEGALRVAGVTGKWYDSIMDAVEREDYPNARAQFQEWNRMAIYQKLINGTFLNAAQSTSGAQSGIPFAISNIVENPLFRSVVKNIVNQVLVQRGIPTVTPILGSGEKDVLDTIGVIITNPVFAKTVQEINAKLTGPKDQSTSAS
ncbi:peptidase m12a astacin [Moniliophthora roreri]|nr:peptidase m12a astacin [Moniliophthora roreri]